MTTPALLEQWTTGSCCMDALEDIVPKEAPPKDPLGVVYRDAEASSSLSEKRLQQEVTHEYTLLALNTLCDYNLGGSR